MEETIKSTVSVDSGEFASLRKYLQDNGVKPESIIDDMSEDNSRTKLTIKGMTQEALADHVTKWRMYNFLG